MNEAQEELTPLTAVQLLDAAIWREIASDLIELYAKNRLLNSPIYINFSVGLCQFLSGVPNNGVGSRATRCSAHGFNGIRS